MYTDNALISTCGNCPSLAVLVTRRRGPVVIDAGLGCAGHEWQPAVPVDARDLTLLGIWSVMNRSVTDADASTVDARRQVAHVLTDAMGYVPGTAVRREGIPPVMLSKPWLSTLGIRVALTVTDHMSSHAAGDLALWVRAHMYLSTRTDRS